MARRALAALLGGLMVAFSGLSATAGAVASGRETAVEAVGLPAVARVVAPTYARMTPNESGWPQQRLDALRGDFHPTVLFADRTLVDPRGRRWYRARLPRRPNGTTGWVRAAALRLTPVGHRIVVRRSQRTLTFRGDGRVLMRTRVAVGARGMETPTGRFYVTARFRPARRFGYLGRFAFETSAWSKLSEWPGGGSIGIHGTDRPHLLGRAVSHGCIRVSNPAVLRLKRLVHPGTPVRVLR